LRVGSLVDVNWQSLEHMMNFDSAISFLSHSNWGFLALWLVLLAVAFTASFPERTSTSTSHGNGKRHP
jgi:hypothetical protein